jgi:DNA-binding transcriptional LysR family regulator
LLPDLVRSVREALPGRDIRFRVARSAALRASFDHNRLDVAVVLDRITHDAGAPDTVPTRWLAAAGWSAPEGEPIPLVLFDHRCGLRTGAVDTLSTAGIRHRVAAEAPDLAGIHAATRAGLGLTLLPAIGRPPDKLAPADGLPLPPPVAFSVRTSSALSARDTRTVTAAVRRAVREHLA